MEGWKLNEGKLQKEFLTEDELWIIFNNVFSTKSIKRTTYKLILLKSIIETCIEKNDNFIIYDTLFSKFTQFYWEPIIKLKLKNCDNAVRGKKTKIEKIFEEYTKRNADLAVLNYNQISDQLKNEIIHKVKNECKKYVVGALYGDTNGYLYEFSNKSEYIKLNNDAQKFIRKYVCILRKLCNYELIRFYKSLINI